MPIDLKKIVEELGPEGAVHALLELVAHADNYIWDQNSLDPVPDDIMSEMQEVARKWQASRHRDES